MPLYEAKKEAPACEVQGYAKATAVGCINVLDTLGLLPKGVPSFGSVLSGVARSREESRALEAAKFGACLGGGIIGLIEHNEICFTTTLCEKNKL